MQPHFAHQIAGRVLSSEENEQNDKLEMNRAIVSDFYNLAFNLLRKEGDRGVAVIDAVMDIFLQKNGKIVDHWDD